MSNIYKKNCPVCNVEQTYATNGVLNRSIRENWVCNKCSSQHQKKIYSDEVIKEVVDLYKEGISFSKIAEIVKIGKKNTKEILTNKGIWVENRDQIKKEFSNDDIDRIVKYYSEDKLSCQKISSMFNCSRQPILVVLRNKGLLRKGLSDGKKIHLSDEQKNTIKNLYLNEYKGADEISKIMNLTESFTNKLLSKMGIIRDKSESASVGLVKRYRGINYNEYLSSLDEFKIYKRKVLNITNRQPIQELPNYDKRGVSGVEGNYHLDHKFSIVEGFKQKIDPNIIGNIRNLEFIPWEQNVKKRTNCSINLYELNI